MGLSMGVWTHSDHRGLLFRYERDGVILNSLLTDFSGVLENPHLHIHVPKICLWRALTVISIRYEPCSLQLHRSSLCFPTAHQQLKREFPSAPCRLAPDCLNGGNELRNREGALTFCFPGSKDFSEVLFSSGSLEILEGMRGGMILGDSLTVNKAEAPHCLGKSREGPSG